jgi:hypothetical protein
VRKLLHNVHSIINRSTIYDDVLNVGMRLIGNALQCIRDGRGSIEASGDDS